MARILARDLQLTVHILEKFMENFKFQAFDLKYIKELPLLQM